MVSDTRCAGNKVSEESLRGMEDLLERNRALPTQKPASRPVVLAASPSKHSDHGDRAFRSDDEVCASVAESLAVCVVPIIQTENSVLLMVHQR